jgi:hypothetical protein
VWNFGPASQREIIETIHIPCASVDFSGIFHWLPKSGNVLQKKSTLRNSENDANAPAISPDEESVPLQPPPAESDEPSITMERGENNNVSIFFSPSNHGKPTRLIFNGIFEKSLLRTFFTANLITTIVLKNICRTESCAFECSEFPKLEHIVFDGGNCRTQMPQTVSKISYLGNYEIEKNLSLPIHVREMAITSELSHALRSLSCGGLARITVDGQSIAADGVIRFDSEFGGLKAIDLSGSSVREVHINNLPDLQHLLLSHSAISSLQISSESMGNLRDIAIIGCEKLQLGDNGEPFLSCPKLTITYNDKTAGKEAFDGNDGNSHIRCHFAKIDGTLD